MDEARTSNPFPAFAVESVELDWQTFQNRSVSTRARRQLEAFLDAYDANETRGCIVGIRGDYGSGKTHLLRYAYNWFRHRNEGDGSTKEPCGDTKTEPSLDKLTNFCIYVNSTGATFLEFVQRQVMPQLDHDFLVDLLHLFLARIAQTEAGALGVTESAVAIIQDDYRKVKDLLSSDLLPVTRIFQAVQDALNEYGDDDEVSHLMLSFLDPRRSMAAHRWLCLGPSLDPSDLRKTGVARLLNSDEMMLNVVRVLAGIFEHVGLRWVLLVDQFEQLMQTEAERRGRQMQSAFKELSEILSDSHGLIIAGHYSGWHVKADFYGRFLTPIIEIPHLKADEVRVIVGTYLDREPECIPEALVGPLASCARGNIRALLLICNRLYRNVRCEMLAATESQVTAAHEEIRHLRDRQAIVDTMVSQLRSRGIAFEQHSHVAAWQPTFAIPSSKKPACLISVIEAREAMQEIENLRAEVNLAALAKEKSGNPHILFVLTGYVSTELFEMLKVAGFDALDGTDRAFDTRMEEKLDGMVTMSGADRSSTLDENQEQRVDDVLRKMEKEQKERKSEKESLESRMAELQTMTKELKEQLVRAQSEKGTVASPSFDVSNILPEDYPRLKYVNAFIKYVFLACCVWLVVTVVVRVVGSGLQQSSSPADLELVEPYSELTGFGDLLLSPIFVVPLFVFAFFMFMIEWSFVDGVIDRLLNMRRTDLVAGRDVYRIVKREEEVLYALRRRSTRYPALRSAVEEALERWSWREEDDY